VTERRWYQYVVARIDLRCSKPEERSYDKIRQVTKQEPLIDEDERLLVKNCTTGLGRPASDRLLFTPKPLLTPFYRLASPRMSSEVAGRQQ
jgi:hypothetical protein